MAQLTLKQEDILAMLDEGKTAREIAQDLGITRNAVYQQIQRMRHNGALPQSYTPTGAPKRETTRAATRLSRLLAQEVSSDGDKLAGVGVLAIVEEIRRTRDELDQISVRLSALLPQ